MPECPDISKEDMDRMLTCNDKLYEQVKILTEAQDSARKASRDYQSSKNRQQHGYYKEITGDTPILNSEFNEIERNAKNRAHGVIKRLRIEFDEAYKELREKIKHIKTQEGYIKQLNILNSYYTDNFNAVNDDYQEIKSDIAINNRKSTYYQKSSDNLDWYMRYSKYIYWCIVVMVTSIICYITYKGGYLRALFDTASNKIKNIKKSKPDEKLDVNADAKLDAKTEPKPDIINVDKLIDNKNNIQSGGEKYISNDDAINKAINCELKRINYSNNIKGLNIKKEGTNDNNYEIEPISFNLEKLFGITDNKETVDLNWTIQEIKKKIDEKNNNLIKEGKKKLYEYKSRDTKAELINNYLKPNKKLYCNNFIDDNFVGKNHNSKWIDDKDRYYKTTNKESAWRKNEYYRENKKSINWKKTTDGKWLPSWEEKNKENTNRYHYVKVPKEIRIQRIGKKGYAALCKMLANIWENREKIYNDDNDNTDVTSRDSTRRENFFNYYRTHVLGNDDEKHPDNRLTLFRAFNKCEKDKSDNSHKDWLRCIKSYNYKKIWTRNSVKSTDMEIKNDIKNKLKLNTTNEGRIDGILKKIFGDSKLGIFSKMGNILDKGWFSEDKYKKDRFGKYIRTKPDYYYNNRKSFVNKAIKNIKSGLSNVRDRATNVVNRAKNAVNDIKNNQNSADSSENISYNTEPKSLRFYIILLCIIVIMPILVIPLFRPTINFLKPIFYPYS